MKPTEKQLEDARDMEAEMFPPEAEDTYIIKWTNLLTGAFGFSKTPKSLKEAEAQCARMNALTRGLWVDDEGKKHLARGKHEPVRVW